VIDFRYHLVSIVAVFLALAIGIVIGASAIKPGVLNVLDNASSREGHQITVQRGTIKSQQNQLGADQAFAQAGAPILLNGLLAGQYVALVTAPGADAGTVNGVTAALKLAGATVTTQAQLQPAFFDTSAGTQNLLETLAQQVAPPGLLIQTKPPGANPVIAGQQQAAQALAAALVNKGTDLPADQVNTILDGFKNQGFLQLSPAGGSAAPHQATLAVVIIPASPPSADADPANLALISVAEQLSLSGRGVVLAGPLSGSGPGSAIDELASGSTGAQLSSVDNADKVTGQILVAQALSYLLAGHKPAAYGVSTGAVPSPAPTPSATPSAASTSSAGSGQPVRG
jgi:Copper transport outer membrane protein, MctB